MVMVTRGPIACQSPLQKKICPASEARMLNEEADAGENCMQNGTPLPLGNLANTP